MNRTTRRAIIIGAATALAAAGFLAVAGKYYVNTAIKRGKKKYSNQKRRDKSVRKKDQSMLGGMVATHNAMVREAVVWMKNNPGEPVEVTAGDGIKLYGELFRKSGSHKYVIIVHGYNCTLRDMYCYGPYFYSKGYNVLFTDLRAHGRSGGDYIGMGWLERFDIKKWCEYIEYLDPDSKIALFGHSMGAAAVLMACGEKLSDNVKACIEDSGYSSVSDMYKTLLKEAYHLPSFPILNAASLVAKHEAGYSFFEADTCKQLEKSHIPTLFIHAEGDSYVPYANVFKLFDAANEPKELYVVPESDHVCACFYDKKTYFERVFGFLDKYM